jgi:hypothetical protein
MHSVISSDLWMERGRQKPFVLHGHDGTRARTLFNPGKHLNAWTNLLHPWGPDEYAIKRLGSYSLDRDWNLERVDLPTEGIPTHGDVYPANGFLVRAPIFNAISQHDQSGTGPVHRHPSSNRFTKGQHQVKQQGELGHRGRFSTRNDQRIDLS